MKVLSYFFTQVHELTAQGGWVFWALVMLAFGIAFALISIVHFLRLPNAPVLSGSEWLRLLRGETADVTPVVNFASDLPLIEHQLFGQIERRIRFAFVLIGTAPLVGLLGTVAGMLTTFHGLSRMGAQAPMDVISGGVSEALITTQTGLVIAVPAFIVATLLRGHCRQLRFGFQKLEMAVRRETLGVG